MNEPYETSRRLLEQLAAAPLPHWEVVAAAAREHRLRPGEQLFRAADVLPSIHCVREGVVKMVYTTADGKEWIKAFVEPGCFFGSMLALQPGGRTSFGAQAVGEAVVERLSFPVLQDLATRHIEWQRAIGEGFRLYGQRKEQREFELLTLSAEERYLGFLRDHPTLESRIPLKDLAGYIRVTPVALSRIRARLRQRATTAPQA